MFSYRQIGLLPNKPYQQIRSLAFSPNNQYIACASDDWLVSIWARKGNDYSLRMRRFVDDGAVFVAFTEYDDLVVVSGNGDIRVFTPNNNFVLYQDGRNASVQSASYSHSSGRLALGMVHGAIKLMTIKKNAPSDPDYHVSTDGVLKGHKYAIKSAVFMSSGRELVTTSIDGSLRMWNTPTLKCKVVQQYAESGGDLLAINPNESLIAHASTFLHDGRMTHGRITLLDRSGQRVMQLAGRRHLLNDMQFTPDGELALAYLDGVVSVMRIDRFSNLVQYEFQLSVGMSVERIAFSPDGHMAIGMVNGNISIYSRNAQNGNQNAS